MRDLQNFENKTLHKLQGKKKELTLKDRNVLNLEQKRKNLRRQIAIF